MSLERIIEKPFFSIIIPIYNVDLHYFDECMNSILGQTFGDFEVILVDDGSREESGSACDQYAQKDARVRVIHQTNQGVSAARNHGIEAAIADWIMFVDADDWIEINACEVLKKYLEKGSCDILLFNAVKEFAGKQERLNYGLNGETFYKTDDVDTRELFYKRAMGSPNTRTGKLCVIYYSWDKVYRRQFLIENDVSYPVGIPRSEDKVFILSCFENMSSLYYIEEVLYHYRINRGSVSNRYSESVDSERIELTTKLLEIATRMDSEIAGIKANSTYAEITKQFYRFTFGIISDVFKQKFFHSDYPRSKNQRDIEVRAFLNTEPFKTSIKNVQYSELPNNVKLKKFMLSHGFASLFYRLKMAKKNTTGKIAE